MMTGVSPSSGGIVVDNLRSDLHSAWRVIIIDS